MINIVIKCTKILFYEKATFTFDKIIYWTIFINLHNNCLLIVNAVFMKYIDDLVGKGLRFHNIAELLFYASARFVPIALPMSILLSSVLVFGRLGEQNELTALKSAGISLFKIMIPCLFLSLF